MKKLDQFILKSFVGPFTAILLLVVFILMMQFLWVYIDELVGKGLSFGVILEFMMWGGAIMLPLALPLATLLSSVMTVGQMSEHSELIAIKASGISLARVMLPMMVASLVICVMAFYAANNLVPHAYNEIYTLREDIGRTKKEINIPTGTFYDGIDGYVLRIGSRNKGSGMMYDVMVYDQTSHERGASSITLADSALMKMSKNKDYLTFQLFNGINYQENNSMRYRDTTLQLQRISFDKQEMIIPLKNYAFQKSSETRYGDQVKAKSLADLQVGKDSVSHLRDSTKALQIERFTTSRTLRYGSQLDTSYHRTAKLDISALSWRDRNSERRAYESAINQAKDYITNLKNDSYDVQQHLWLLRHSDVEILKKFAGALACLIMFFIGAPLGAFVNRKTGLGASAIVAVLFFVFYWVVDITGVKLARDGATSAVVGVFISTFILFPTGMFLTWKAIRDESILGSDTLVSWWRRIKSKFIRMFRKTRIVYMGTPEFAVAPLDALVQAGYKVVGVVTVADKPSGRGLKVSESAVKQYAVAHGIPVLQPLKLKDPEFLASLAAWKADLFVVVAFRMLPEVVWKMPPLGTFNLHAALLPQYRGAAPINWAVINGERMTGATTFMIDANIDTGGIILRQELRIGESDTAGDVHDALMPIGSKLVVETVEGIIQHNVETRVQRSFIQGSEVLKPAPKLTRELCHIDWDAPTTQVYNLIRGLSPYPTAFTELVADGGQPQTLKIFRAERRDDLHAAPGTLLSDGKSYLAIATRDGAVGLLDIQLAGKKRMEVKPFLAGFRDPQGYTCTKGTSAAEIAKTLA